MDTFEALADPVRRQILVLVRSAPRTAGWLAGQFIISRPAVSRHLRVLRESDLVRDEASGRERVYRLAPEALGEVRTLLDALTRPWEQAFDALDTEVRRAHRDRTAATTTTAQQNSA